MKKIPPIILTALALAALVITGCTTTEILKAIDTTYRSVRIVLTDPMVKDQIPPARLARLADIERQYLKAADDIRDTGVDNASPLSVVVDCADDFLMVIDSLVLSGRHEREINAIGLSVRFLRGQIQCE